MPTQLDNALEAIITGLTAEDQPFATVPFNRDGVDMPAFAGAPPSLAHYFAHFCNQNKDVPFLVDGDIRLTFGETYAAATCVAEGLVQTHGLAKGDRVGLAARNSASGTPSTLSPPTVPTRWKPICAVSSSRVPLASAAFNAATSGTVTR